MSLLELLFTLIGILLFGIIELAILFGISFVIAMHEADVRGIQRSSVWKICIIPFVGIKRIKSLKEPEDFKLQHFVTKRGKAKTIILGILLAVIVGLAVYGAMFSSLVLLRMFSIFVLLTLVFVNQSVCYSIADKKAMNPYGAGFFGLIPVFSLGYYMCAQGKKRILVESVNKTYSAKEIIGRLGIYLELIILSFVVIVPIIYLLGSSLSPAEQIPTTLWPDKPTFLNFKILFTQKMLKGATEVDVYYWYWFKNTAMIAICTMVFSVLFITGTAYIFARFNFKGKKAGLLGMLILQMFPSFLSLIATYNLLDLLGLLNKPLVLVVIYTAGAIPYNTWLIKGFLQNIPKDLDESATIDGANKMQIFFKIILPLSLPIITFVAIGQFMSPWLDYILPSYILKGKGDKATQVWTIAMGLFSFINDVGGERYRPTLFAAGSLFIAIPIAVLYVVFQRYLIEGITAGATKG